MLLQAGISQGTSTFKDIIIINNIEFVGNELMCMKDVRTYPSRETEHFTVVFFRDSW